VIGTAIGVRGPHHPHLDQPHRPPLHHHRTRAL